jgi:GTPase SAR1 family protein
MDSNAVSLKFSVLSATPRSKSHRKSSKSSYTEDVLSPIGVGKSTLINYFWPDDSKTLLNSILVPFSHLNIGGDQKSQQLFSAFTTEMVIKPKWFELNNSGGYSLLNYVLSSDAVIMMFDLTSLPSFTELKHQYLTFMQEQSSKPSFKATKLTDLTRAFILVGNKLDLVEKDPSKRKVTRKMINSLLQQIDAPVSYIEIASCEENQKFCCLDAPQQHEYQIEESSLVHSTMAEFIRLVVTQCFDLNFPRTLPKQSILEQLSKKMKRKESLTVKDNNKNKSNSKRSSSSSSSSNNDILPDTAKSFAEWKKKGKQKMRNKKEKCSIQ